MTTTTTQPYTQDELIAQARKVLRTYNIPAGTQHTEAQARRAVNRAHQLLVAKASGIKAKRGHVTIYDAATQRLETEAKYIAVCERHNEFIEAGNTIAEARTSLDSLEFCDACRDHDHNH